ncbi:hexaprenyldihydroxybenzoate methyltransferase, mitochondrial, partial [Asbolus verrucosus]
STMRNLSNTGSVDTNELKHFKQFTKEWWDKIGPCKGLHSMNKLRIPLIRDGLINVNVVSQHNVNSPTPLKGISILDVGCGGGILTEPLARIGGEVTGLDASPDLIEMAKAHSELENLQNIRYVCSSIEEHAEDNLHKYDAVVASEIIEHVTQKEEFLKACMKCLKPGGSFFLTTLSKTWLANVAAIWLAENWFQILPKGTHQYDKFVKPHDVQRILNEERCQTVLLHGMFYNVLTNDWSWCSNNNVSYALHAVKYAT